VWGFAGLQGERRRAQQASVAGIDNFFSWLEAIFLNVHSSSRKGERCPWLGSSRARATELFDLLKPLSAAFGGALDRAEDRINIFGAWAAKRSH
jgi:hypothetical protein